MAIMVFSSLILIGVGVLFLDRYLKVRKINQKTLQIIKLKTKGRVHPLVKHLNLSPSLQNNLKNSLRFAKKEGALGGAFAGMSILDIYTATNKHQEVLQTIEARFPNEMGDANSISWLNKILKLEKNNSSQSYISAYAGEKAEIESIDTLRELGYENVSQFESKTHPDNDLKAIDSEGNEVHFSVKSRSSVADFQKEVAEHPDSKNYVVNSELYQDMEESGLLMDYENKGIHITDGDFSHIEHIQEAETAFEHIGQSVDVSDNIPLIALAMLGYKTFNNIIDFKKGKQSKKELGINIAMDTVGIGGRAVGAWGGAQAGAIVGTPFGPIGTVAGSIAGVAIGYITTSQIMKDIKEDRKWGDIIEAIDYYGEMYHPIFMYLEEKDFRKEDIFKNFINKKNYNRVYNCPQILANLKKEKRIYKNNSRLLSRLCLSPKSIKETLIVEYIKSLKKYLINTESAIIKSFEILQEILKNIEERLPEDERETRMKRYIGELVIENEEIFIETDSTEEVELLKGYHLQKKECPNHPYKISNNSNKYFKQILWKTFKEVSA